VLVRCNLESAKIRSGQRETVDDTKCLHVCVCVCVCVCVRERVCVRLFYARILITTDKTQLS
jgi:hypothetical protein